MKNGKTGTETNSAPATAAERAVRVISLAASLLLNAVLALYLCETVSRCGRSSALIWMAMRPDVAEAEILFVFFFSLTLAFALDRPGCAIRLVNLPLLLFAAANHYKLLYRDEVLQLSDLFQAKEALLILPDFGLAFSGVLLVAVCVLAVFVPALYRKQRLGLGRLRLLCLLPLAAALAFGNRAMSAPSEKFFRETELYDAMGLAYGLAKTRPRSVLAAPEGYGPERVAEILAGAGDAAPTGGETPDIFFILSESLYDLTKLGELQMSGDPLAGFKALQKAHMGCDVMSAHLGGGTFISEYEVLTGYRASDTPGAVYNDRSAVRAGMQTLLSVLKARGYRSAAFHANDGSFYSRKGNYRDMGFDEAYFRDDGLPQIEEKIGPFPTDEAFFREVLNVYDREKQDGPVFFHLVTFQNHGGYAYDYGRRDILVKNREGAQKKVCENYANAVLTHVEALQAFLDRLSVSGRKAVVVVWGDHAPANIGEFGLAYPKGARAVLGYQTPMLIWSNYDTGYSIGEPCIAAYRLGAIVLDILGFSDDPYFGYLARACRPDLCEALKAPETDGEIVRDDDVYEKLNGELLLLHYDRLKGKAYWKAARQ